MKTNQTWIRNGLLSIAFAVCVLAGSNQAWADDHNGFYDNHHQYHHYEYYHHHRGYWDQRSGVRVWISI